MSGGYFDYLNVHEWAEHTVTKRLPFLEEDRRNRFIYDGLAEYAACVHAGLRPKAPDSLIRLRGDGITRVNLLKKFLAMRGQMDQPMDDALREQGYAPGYALSFAFWYGLCERHGESVVREFLSLAAQSEKRETKSLVRILERVTGERDIWTRLKRADVLEGIELLKRLAENET